MPFFFVRGLGTFIMGPPPPINCHERFPSHNRIKCIDQGILVRG